MKIDWLKKLGGATVGMVLVAGFLIFVGLVPAPWRLATAAVPAIHRPSGPFAGVELVPGKAHTLTIPDEVRKTLGIRKGQHEMLAVAEPPKQFPPMVLPGSTSLDPTRLYRIRARFAPARVIEIGKKLVLVPGADRSEERELRPGDRVQKGDLLGIFYSPDVGNKKNDLIDALVQLRLDQEILDMAKSRKESVPEVFLLTAQRNVNGDVNAIERAVSNLRTWDIPEEDIQAVYKEVAEISKRKGKRDPEKDKLWPRVELHAPADGTIVERNVSVKEMIVDGTVNLFQIANVDRLLVVANAPEDDLPTLNGLESRDRKWTVRTVGAKAGHTLLSGTIDEIGYLIDPNQHTAVIKGYVDNPGGAIRAGQFVSASVPVPPPQGVVEVPIDAVSEDGEVCVVFVETDAGKHQYTMRRVQLTHRFEKSAFVRSEPVPKEDQLSAEEQELGVLPREPLRPGERVLTTAVGELKATLLDKESQPNKEERSR